MFKTAVIGKKRLFCSLLGMVLLASSLLNAKVAAAPNNQENQQWQVNQNLPAYEPDRLIIMPNANAITQDVYDQIKQAVADANCKLIDDPKFLWNSGLFYVQTQPGQLEVSINRLKAKNICKFVQKNWIFKPCSNGGAPIATKQNQQFRSFLPDDPYRTKEWHLVAVHVPAKRPNHRQSCGLIDRGLNTNLQEFKEIKKLDCLGSEEPNHPLQAMDVPGDCSHSTPLATTMIAANGNNLLTTGMCDYPSFWFERTFGPAEDGTTTDRDLFYSMSRMAVSMPVGMSARPVCIPFNVAPPSSLSNQSDHPILHYVMKRNHDNMNMMYFVPAGNDGKYDANPRVPYINVVSAANKDGELCSFSNYGKNVTFTCPGEDIYCSDAQGKLKIGAGTSYAAAIATACAGLISAEALDVKAGQSKASDFEYLMGWYAFKPKGSSDKFGYGVPNCDAVIKYLYQQNKGYPGYWEK